MNPLYPCFRLSRLFACFLLAASGLRLAAEAFTLTDKQGRTINANVISVADGQAVIRRDDGQVFNLALSLLADPDQRKLKDWASKEAAKPLPAGAVQLELSRGVFQTIRKDSDVTVTSGETIKNGRTTTEEKWGYSVTIINKTSKPLENLRVEYRLFATVDDVHVKDKQGLKKKSYRSQLDTVPEMARTVFRTETISAFKMKYNANIRSAKTGDTSSRETLYGIWFRVYQGDQLLQETAMPSTLTTSETW